MTTAQYSIYICDPFGQRLRVLTQAQNSVKTYYIASYVAAPSARTGDAGFFTSLKYSRVVNDVSTLTLVLPGTFDPSILRIPDGRIEVWRRLPSGREYLDTDTIWLIKAVEYTRSDKGEKAITVEADTPMGLLDARVNYAFDAEYLNTIITAGIADDMIRDIAVKAIGVTGAGFGTNRSLEGYVNFPNVTLNSSATLSKSFGWRNTLKTLQEIAEASTQAGVYMAFDIVAPTPDTLEFRTYTQQRGVDHRFPSGQNPVLLSPDFGNLAETKLRIDHRDVKSKIFCGGKGNGRYKTLGEAQDLDLIGASPFGYREAFVEYSNSSDTTTLNNEASGELRTRRPRITFRGKIVPTEDTQYGVHWSWGDYVTAQDFGRSLDSRIDAITVTVEGGKESVDAYIKAETLS